MSGRLQRIAGGLLFTPTPHADERGFFCRTFDAEVVRVAGIDPAAFARGTACPAQPAGWCAACMRAAGTARPSSSAAPTARSSTSSWTCCGAPRRPAELGKLPAPQQRAGLALPPRRLPPRLPGPDRPGRRLLPHRPPARSRRGCVDRVRRPRNWLSPGRFRRRSGRQRDRQAPPLAEASKLLAVRLCTDPAGRRGPHGGVRSLD